jgi:hypothetical protein
MRSFSLYAYFMIDTLKVLALKGPLFIVHDILVRIFAERAVGWEVEFLSGLRADTTSFSMVNQIWHLG